MVVTYTYYYDLMEQIRYIYFYDIVNKYMYYIDRPTLDVGREE